ncbi:cyclic lactone autoinducer peptide [Ruthenibacterium lactatiformans]|jgi:cyclic lactone autoinducer peptide|uniref:cyclic lactone autoinducer peptide n=1 Tax=Ruthenibacterium lactatiformans TaxID=1550024 RepID=UPI003D767D96
MNTCIEPSPTKNDDFARFRPGFAQIPLRPQQICGIHFLMGFPRKPFTQSKNRRYIMKKCEKGFFKACSKFIGKAAKIGANDRCYGLHYQPKKPAALKK